MQCLSLHLGSFRWLYFLKPLKVIMNLDFKRTKDLPKLFEKTGTDHLCIYLVVMICTGKHVLGKINYLAGHNPLAIQTWNITHCSFAAFALVRARHLPVSYISQIPLNFLRENLIYINLYLIYINESPPMDKALVFKILVCTRSAWMTCKITDNSFLPLVSESVSLVLSLRICICNNTPSSAGTSGLDVTF